MSYAEPPPFPESDEELDNGGWNIDWKQSPLVQTTFPDGTMMAC
jgi:hypothetical protein